MSFDAPRYCRPEAFRQFVEQIPRLDEVEGLVHAAVAIAQHSLPEVDGASTWRRIEELVAQVRQRVTSGQPQALFARAHEVLFDDEGFRGNAEQYYDPHNSFLPRVLDTRLGIPITLTLVYYAVLRQLGLEAHGISAPGHFLARVDVDGEQLYVDPFYQGRVLSREESFQRLEQALGTRVPRSDDLLVTATHRAWISRMLGNLRVIFERERQNDDLNAMHELALALESRVS